MCFFPRNGATLNVSFCFFIHQGISFPRGGDVSSEFCYFHKVKINIKTDPKLWKTFFCKSRNYCDIFISTKRKMLHQQILFPQNRKVFNDLYYFERVENTRGRNLKMCLFPRREKNQVIFFISTYIYFTFHEVGNISPMVLFPRRGKKFIDLYHFQNVENASQRNFKFYKLSKTV